MEEEKDKKGNLTGYKIGKSVSVHNNIYDPESWFVTIRPIQLFGESLCKKTCTKEEIARYVNVLLTKKRNVIDNIINDVVPFT